MKRPGQEPCSELMTAAGELDAELRAFAELADAIKHEPLNSQKKMQRGAKMFQEVADADLRLMACVQRMVAALTQARQAQQSQIETVQAHAQAYEARAAILQQLLLDYGALGESARGLNVLLQELAAMPITDAAARDEQADKLANVVGLLDAVAIQAQRLAQHATAQNFHDIARLGDALRQQLLAACKKVQRLQRGAEPYPTGSDGARLS